MHAVTDYNQSSAEEAGAHINAAAQRGKTSAWIGAVIAAFIAVGAGYIVGKLIR